MLAGSSAAESCAGCGLVIAGGMAGCQSLMDECLARDFSDIAYFRLHRLLVDTYSLQHPEHYCASAKRLAAHLTGLCWALEHDGNRAVGSEALLRWLTRSPPVEQPEFPRFRGTLTIASVHTVRDASRYAQAVELWARATWEAYAALQPLARRWIHQALNPSRKP
ncbi:MAG TPA: DUF5946 family protein [Terriglobales bacterium]|jgi:hypothetical protein|nr:DUF5946 family protein [Terriglobales bacterium]